MRNDVTVRGNRYTRSMKLATSTGCSGRATGKPRFVIPAIAGMAMFLLSACGSSSSSDPASLNPKASESVRSSTPQEFEPSTTAASATTLATPRRLTSLDASDFSKSSTCDVIPLAEISGILGVEPDRRPGTSAEGIASTKGQTNSRPVLGACTWYSKSPPFSFTVNAVNCIDDSVCAENFVNQIDVRNLAVTEEADGIRIGIGPAPDGSIVSGDSYGVLGGWFVTAEIGSVDDPTSAANPVASITQDLIYRTIRALLESVRGVPALG